MPYTNISALPKSIRDALPVGAQKIFVGAFNSAMKQGKTEESAFKIAWSAVKTKYRNTSSGWALKQLGTPTYIEGAVLSRENLATPKKKKPKKKPNGKH